MNKKEKDNVLELNEVIINHNMKGRDYLRIMINGRSLSGKDTIANYLVEKYGFKKISFAEPIYKLAKEFFNMTTKDRKLLQDIGQKFREIDKDVWVKYLLKNINTYDDYVISDVRQANEYILCKEKNFIPIRVSADLNIRIERCRKRDGIEPDISLWENESETGADNFDYYEIDNNGTLQELYDKIDELMNTLGYKPKTDFKAGDKVKIIKILNPEKAKHLTKYIEKEGYIYSWIIRNKNEGKRYKVYILDGEIEESAYFLNKELELIER